MRERLIELLRKADEASNVPVGGFPSHEEEMQAFYESIADYLIDKGVIVLPCAVGDTVWVVTDRRDFKKRCGGYISIDEPPDIEIKETTFNLLLSIYIGKSVFLTKEEAEAKLRELNTHERE